MFVVSIYEKYGRKSSARQFHQNRSKYQNSFNFLHDLAKVSIIDEFYSRHIGENDFHSPRRKDACVDGECLNE